MRKSYTACGYIPEVEINVSNEDANIPYSAANAVNLLEKLCVECARTNFEDKGAVVPDPFSPSDYDGDDENEEMFSEFD